MNRANYNRIIRDCFWDTNITITEIKQIAEGEDKQQKAFLFEKILLNSTAFFLDLEVFKKDDLEELLENYQIPEFNEEYSFRRKNMAEVYFFNKPLLIEELKWQI